MTITLLQQDIAWGNIVANQRAAEKAILAAPKSDLYVLPEMWSTGFATDPKGMAEKDNCSLHWMQQMADRMGAAIAGSVAVEKHPHPGHPHPGPLPQDGEGKFYNRFYFVKPSNKNTPLLGEKEGAQPSNKNTPPWGETEGATLLSGEMEGASYYDKRHLFTYGGEHLRYTAGKERVIVEWCGVRFLLQVCYDLRFPETARNAASGDEAYDVVLYVASWPKSRRAAWDTLLRARAIENQCYVCGVCRTGDDPMCHYNGGTAIIDAYGRTVVACPDDEVSLVTATIDLEALMAFRKKFPVLEDI